MASILVTGASRGIGRATCVSLGRAGHRVFATMRDPANATELSAIASAESLPISLSAMDVDSDESVRQAVGDIVGQYGPVDVLVNNAGIERRGSVEELAPSKGCAPTRRIPNRHHQQNTCDHRLRENYGGRKGDIQVYSTPIFLDARPRHAVTSHPCPAPREPPLATCATMFSTAATHVNRFSSKTATTRRS